ncbi:MAG: roadblock/LC7 domain-containing protein [Candidatus Lokiarchaeota archaeon]|nr:roadblock/LC7 domain-containing protein [Candidatus Lokiarchaeota archaeon]
MSTDVNDEIRSNLMNELARIESTSDLQNLTILSRNGMKIATSKSHHIDVDPLAASSAALIDVGLNFVQNLHHGDLKEILIRGKEGYAILMHIDSNYLTFAGLTDLARIGYYLELLRIRCKKFSYILAGGKVTEELRAELEAEKVKKEKMDEKAAQMFESDVSASDDIVAMQDVLSFLDEWEGDEVPSSTNQDSTKGIVSISEDYMIGQDIEPEASETSSTHSSYHFRIEDQDFPIYENEVPPIPLDDVEALEIGTTKVTSSEEEPPVPDGLNFNQFAADEYEDFDDEAMLEVLDDLGYTSKRKEKK